MFSDIVLEICIFAVIVAVGGGILTVYRAYKEQVAIDEERERRLREYREYQEMGARPEVQKMEIQREIDGIMMQKEGEDVLLQSLIQEELDNARYRMEDAEKAKEERMKAKLTQLREEENGEQETDTHEQ